MNVIREPDKKVADLLSKLPTDVSNDEFLEKFKEEYPKDYQRCWDKYKYEEAHTKKVKDILCNTPTNM